MAHRNRYREMEQLMTRALLLDFLAFLLYLLFASFGIVWLKILLSISIILISGTCLAILYMTRELLRPRSRWMTASATAIVVSLIFSLILNYP